jgi:tRNA G18 (ribose-2'-O)-methylase SpoU
MSADFEHQRHKPPQRLERERELVIACAPMSSHVNLSRILRAAGCCAVPRVIACGNASIDKKIARDGADSVQLEVHRSLVPVLKKLKSEGYRIVGLEQTTNSVCIYDFAFERRTAVVLGNERLGLTEEELRCVDSVVEIPVYGRPFSHNVATSAALAMYEYCRQFPLG